jgi:hypothetical protein
MWRFFAISHQAAHMGAEFRPDYIHLMPDVNPKSGKKGGKDAYLSGLATTAGAVLDGLDRR